MSRSRPPRKVTYFEPVPPRLARNTIIESTFEVGRRFRCTMRVDCGELDPGAVIRLAPGEWHPRMPEQLDEEELAGPAISALTISICAPMRCPLPTSSGRRRRCLRRPSPATRITAPPLGLRRNVANL
jgi:hypothetical protein